MGKFSNISLLKSYFSVKVLEHCCWARLLPTAWQITRANTIFIVAEDLDVASGSSEFLSPLYSQGSFVFLAEDGLIMWLSSDRISFYTYVIDPVEEEQKNVEKRWAIKSFVQCSGSGMELF